MISTGFYQDASVLRHASDQVVYGNTGSKSDTLCLELEGFRRHQGTARGMGDDTRFLHWPVWKCPCSPKTALYPPLHRPLHPIGCLLIVGFKNK